MNMMKKACAGLMSAAASGTLLTLTAFASENAASTGNGTQQTAPTLTAMLLQFAPLVGALILLYFILLRPQQKREKEAQAMRENVRVGEEICTAGGIVGIVLKVEDDTVVIETGAERNKIRIKKWAIHENITQMEERQKAEKERKAARMKGVSPAAADGDSKKKKSEE